MLITDQSSQCQNSGGRPKHAQIRRRLLVIVLLPVVICSGLYFALANWPRYYELDVPSPASVGWYSTEMAIRTWEGGGGSATFFVWRRDTAVTRCDCDTAPNYDSLVAYFDQWLQQHGWERKLYKNATPCPSYMPESEFLTAGKYAHMLYLQTGSQGISEKNPFVCLAIWPLDSDPTHGFNIVIMTVGPSFLTEFAELFRWD
jgi:hypothetical protein